MDNQKNEVLPVVNPEEGIDSSQRVRTDIEWPTADDIIAMQENNMARKRHRDSKGKQGWRTKYNSPVEK